MGKAEKDRPDPRRRPEVTVLDIEAPACQGERGAAAKPTLAWLGVDPATLEWQRSGGQDGSFEVAFVASGRTRHRGGGTQGLAARQEAAGQDREGGAGSRPGLAVPADWVLLRVAGDPAGRVLVYDRAEWMCFLDGAVHGEFDLPDDLADPPEPTSPDLSPHESP